MTQPPIALTPDSEQNLHKGVAPTDTLGGEVVVDKVFMDEVSMDEVFMDEDLSMDDLLSLWHDFSDVPINDWDEIEQPFMHFQAGTYRFDVWHWFDERWPGGVYELLFL